MLIGSTNGEGHIEGSGYDERKKKFEIIEIFFLIYLSNLNRSSNSTQPSQDNAKTFEDMDPFSDPDELHIPILQTKSVKSQGYSMSWRAASA